MKRLQAGLITVGAALFFPTPGMADDDGMIRDVAVRDSYSTQDASLIRLARAVDPQSWGASVDFPDGVPAQRMQVAARVAVSLDETGRATACAPNHPRFSVSATKLEHISIADWSSAACAVVLKDGKFSYAIDKEGVPVPSKTAMSVTFTIRPSEEGAWTPGPPPPAPSITRTRPKPKKQLKLTLDDPAITNSDPRVSLAISAKGRVDVCRIWDSTGSDRSDAAVCKYLSSQKYSPARDSNKRKISERLVVTLPVGMK